MFDLKLLSFDCLFPPLCHFGYPYRHLSYRNRLSTLVLVTHTNIVKFNAKLNDFRIYLHKLFIEKKSAKRKVNESKSRLDSKEEN